MLALAYTLLAALFASEPDRTGRPPPREGTAALCAYLESGATNRLCFLLTGTIISVDKTTSIRPYIVIQDDHGCAGMYCDLGNEPRVGDYVTAACEGCTEYHEPWCTARRLTKLGTRPIPAPARSKIKDLSDGRHNYQRVIVSGTVVDSFPDDVSADFQLVLLKDGDHLLPLSAPSKPKCSQGRLVNARIEACGTYHKSVSGSRKYSGPYLHIGDANDIKVLTPPPDDPFDVPPLATQFYRSPSDIAQQGRRSASGEVIAVWQQNRLIIRTDDGVADGVSLAHGVEPPACGTQITAVGYPATDLFNLELTRAIFKPVGSAGHQPEKPIDLSLQTICKKEVPDRAVIDARLHCQLVRLVATVKSLPAERELNKRILVGDDTISIPVDLGLHPKCADSLQVGCTVEITGRCLLESDRWRPDLIFPRPTGFVIAIRSPSDIVVLSSPSWWTPRRLFVVILSLLALLVFISVWNRILRRLVERRSRELLREQTARADVALKIAERTRLAVELHDSLSQTLTGISFQIDAAEKAHQKEPGSVGRYLGNARRVLASCREELKNCLWDLRNNALESDNLEQAIRTTLEPHVIGTVVAVDLKVPRSRLSDSTLHNILSIVRELTINAIRHGAAKHVEIKGGLDGRTLQIEVSDDGCGFVPEDCPGMSQGHFGLLGIGERLEKLGGQMSIKSAPGEGTTVFITIEGHHDED